MPPPHHVRLFNPRLYLLFVLTTSCAAVLEVGEGSSAIGKAIKAVAGKCVIDCSGNTRFAGISPSSPRYQALQAAADLHAEHVEPAMTKFKLTASWNHSSKDKGWKSLAHVAGEAYDAHGKLIPSKEPIKHLPIAKTHLFLPPGHKLHLAGQEHVGPAPPPYAPHVWEPGGLNNRAHVQYVDSQHMANTSERNIAAIQASADFYASHVDPRAKTIRVYGPISHGPYGESGSAARHHQPYTVARFLDEEGKDLYSRVSGASMGVPTKRRLHLPPNYTYLDGRNKKHVGVVPPYPELQRRPGWYPANAHPSAQSSAIPAPLSAEDPSLVAVKRKERQSLVFSDDKPSPMNLNWRPYSRPRKKRPNQGHEILERRLQPPEALLKAGGSGHKAIESSLGHAAQTSSAHTPPIDISTGGPGGAAVRDTKAPRVEESSSTKRPRSHARKRQAYKKIVRHIDELSGIHLSTDGPPFIGHALGHAKQEMQTNYAVALKEAVSWHTKEVEPRLHTFVSMQGFRTWPDKRVGERRNQAHAIGYAFDKDGRAIFGPPEESSGYRPAIRTMMYLAPGQKYRGYVGGPSPYLEAKKAMEAKAQNPSPTMRWKRRKRAQLLAQSSSANKETAEKSAGQSSASAMDRKDTEDRDHQSPPSSSARPLLDLNRSPPPELESRLRKRLVMPKDAEAAAEGAKAAAKTTTDGVSAVQDGTSSSTAGKVLITYSSAGKSRIPGGHEATEAAAQYYKHNLNPKLAQFKVAKPWNKCGGRFKDSEHLYTTGTLCDSEGHVLKPEISHGDNVPGRRGNAKLFLPPGHKLDFKGVEYVGPQVSDSPYKSQIEARRRMAARQGPPVIIKDAHKIKGHHFPSTIQEAANAHARDVDPRLHSFEPQTGFRVPTHTNKGIPPEFKHLPFASGIGRDKNGKRIIPKSFVTGHGTSTYRIYLAEGQTHSPYRGVTYTGEARTPWTAKSGSRHEANQARLAAIRASDPDFGPGGRSLSEAGSSAPSRKLEGTKPSAESKTAPSTEGASPQPTRSRSSSHGGQSHQQLSASHPSEDHRSHGLDASSSERPPKRFAFDLNQPPSDSR
ncbi:hypothetical protein IE81DRAFT_125385 [Ceraceosorus guamensis]|uniref:Uncharacterized protein n=1 Tax=Ceraceosorus guamensis TaxID=1522189 RepID=A0A316VYJ1_9BASI|nr:hypothetical protein IE81DRAFT_125385 [Ceraceosorus guamensis]PWN42512.1 hypothetical protein IE81DRAFT_125385 [Ceraceosorus guamensis]